MANNYVWLLAVSVSGNVVIAQVDGVRSSPGDVIELEGNRLGRVLFGGLYTEGEAELVQAVTLAKPAKAIAYYPRKLLKEADVDADS